jgi:hypothetical protein
LILWIAVLVFLGPQICGLEMILKICELAGILFFATNSRIDLRIAVLVFLSTYLRIGDDFKNLGIRGTSLLATGLWIDSVDCGNCFFATDLGIGDYFKNL